MAKKEKAELTSAFELFTPSVNLLKKYLGVFFLLLVVPSLLVNFDTSSDAMFGPVSAMGGILSLIFLAPSIYAETRAAGGHDITLSESFNKGFRFFWRALGLVILVGLVIGLGLIAFIVPGVIFLRRYILSPYYLVDRDLGILEAMRLSAQETKPFSGSIYGILGVLLLIGLLNIFGVVGTIASAVLGILYSLAFPIRYFEVKKAYRNLPKA